MPVAQTNSSCLKDPRAMRIEARRRGGFDDNAVERACNKGIIPKYWLHADDLLPPPRSIPRSVGTSALEDRDWAWLLELWLIEKDGEPGSDKMVETCRAHLTMDDWRQLLEAWEKKPEGQERDRMLAECRAHLGLDNPQQEAA